MAKNKVQTNRPNLSEVGNVNVSLGNLRRNAAPEPKTTGVKIRGTGAATKGKIARGPMA